ncbi:MAG: hypothetical protein OXJ53_08680 [Gammaproteobacteria bacterium]|nr:hypothetical protein [Gammaproteobacteria bacterium]MDD9961831.1 hypothetical protein [Gammaproteobacteria bacterium]
MTRHWLEDDYYEDDDDPRYWHVQSRQPFGRIAIANSDAGAEATVDAAIVQARRAIRYFKTDPVENFVHRNGW